jgi:endoglucanase
MAINVKLLADVCRIPGTSGFEHKVRAFVQKELKGIVDEMYTDHMGNLITIKKGKSDKKRAMAAAHMDEIGFMITHIDDKGFLRFHTIGGFDPKTLTAQRVIVHGKKDLVGVMGAKPIHVMTPEERAKVPQTKDYFIDLGLSKAEVEKLVSVGDPVTRERELIEMGNNVNVKSLDNRVSVFILIEVMKELKKEKIPYDFYGVFTVQEEVGLRGALVAGHHINPDFSFGLDTTIANDTPGAPAHEMITELGKGTAVKVMDASVICDTRMVEYMKQVATKKKIKYQLEILTAGGTDTAGMQKMAKNGTIAGAVSIPTRNIHQVIEMCDKDDIRGSIDLLKESVKGLDTFNWEHK